MAPSALPDPPEEPKRVWRCFAIGPIGDRFAEPGTPERDTYESALEIYEAITVAACQRHGIELTRADDLPGSGEITEQICRHVREADIVIADLGGGNANVMYELGLRHSTGKPTIQIGDHEQLPFDVANIRTIRFKRTSGGLIRARKELEAALEAGLRDGFEVLTPARIMRPVEDRAYEVVVATDDDAPGAVEVMAALETELEILGQDFDQVGHAVVEVARIVEASGPDFERLNRQDVQPSAWVVAFANFSKAIDGPAEDLDKATVQLSQRMKEVDGGVRHILGFVAEMPKESKPEDVNEFLGQLVELEAFPEEFIRELNDVGQLLDWFKILSRQLRKPVGRISASIKRLNQAAACVNEWAEAARALQ